jgi:hypothetical protein
MFRNEKLSFRESAHPNAFNSQQRSEFFKLGHYVANSDRTVVGELVGSGLRPAFLDKFHKRGVNLPSWLAGTTGLERTPNLVRPESYG